MSKLNKVISESGLQAQCRIVRTKRIQNFSIQNLNNQLFIDGGPLPGQIVEILGPSMSGKTCLVEEIIAQTILPKKYGGKNAGVYLLCTLFSLEIPRLLAVMNKLAEGHCQDMNLNDDEIREGLKNLMLIRCYDHKDIEITLHSLREKLLLTENAKFSLVMMDHIGAFYWLKQTDTTAMKIETYMKSLTDYFEKLCADYQITFVYTRLNSFATEGQMEKDRKGWCYIELIELESENKTQQMFAAQVQLDNQTKTVWYQIKGDGIRWTNKI